MRTFKGLHWYAQHISTLIPCFHGNPYAIGFSGDRDEVIRKFKHDFEREFLRFTREDVLKLKGKTLGCHCKPAACHGDVIAEYLNALDDES